MRDLKWNNEKVKEEAMAAMREIIAIHRQAWRIDPISIGRKIKRWPNMSLSKEAIWIETLDSMKWTWTEKETQYEWEYRGKEEEVLKEVLERWKKRRKSISKFGYSKVDYTYYKDNEVYYMSV